jgi:excisionase family DNA binding protein
MTTEKQTTPISIVEVPEILARHEQHIQDLQKRIESLSAEPEKPITVYEAARFTNKAVQTLYGLVSARKIPFHKNGKQLSFFKSELVNWIKNSRSKNFELMQYLKN